MGSGLAVLALASVTAFGGALVVLHRVLRADVAPLAPGIGHSANGPAPGAPADHHRPSSAWAGWRWWAGSRWGWRPRPGRCRGLLLLGLWSGAPLATAGFPIDAPGAPPTPAGLIHGLAGLSFVLPGAAALLLARGIARDPR